MNQMHPLQRTARPPSNWRQSAWDPLIDAVEAHASFKSLGPQELSHCFAALDRISAELTMDPAGVSSTQLQAWVWACARDEYEEIALRHMLQLLLIQAFRLGLRDAYVLWDVTALPTPTLLH